MYCLSGETHKHTLYAFNIGAFRRALVLIFVGPAKSIPVVANARPGCMRAFGRSPTTDWNVKGLVLKQITHFFTTTLATFLLFNGQY